MTPSSTAVLGSDIAQQPLAQAMRSFARESGIQVMYVSTLAQGLESRGARAGVPLRQALEHLLAGTGLGFEFLNARSVRLKRQAAVARDKRGAPAQAAANATAPGGYALEEIVISATKRDEPLSDVAMSALSLSDTELARAQIRGLGELASHAPGLQYDLGTQFGSGIMSNLSMRGISAERGSAPTVGVYIDDVPIHAVRISLYNSQPLTFDLERVEVLRGPQGTLFGSSALGGAVRFITRSPNAVMARRRYSVGLGSTARGAASGEASMIWEGALAPGRLGARASFWYRRDGGYIDRVNPFTRAIVERDANSTASKVLRLGLVYEPSSNLRFTPAYHQQSIALHDTPMLFTSASGAATPAMPYATDQLHNGKLLAQPYHDQFRIGSMKVEKFWRTLALTSVSSSYQRFSATTVDETNALCLNYFRGCGNASGPAWPANASQAIPTFIRMRQGAFTQELRLGPADRSGRIDWTAGGFYSRTYSYRLERTFQVTVPAAPALRNEQWVRNTYLNGFGRVALALSPRWTVAAGTRFGWQSGEFTRDLSGYARAQSTHEQLAGGNTAEPTAPRLELSFRPAAEQLYYFTVARGSRPGSANIVRQCGTAQVPASYRSDSLWSHELGAKRSWQDQRLRLEASAFRVVWRDPQMRASDACGNTYFANAGRILSRGMELAGDLNLARFNIHATVGYQDTRYRRTVMNSTGQLIAERGAVLTGLPAAVAPWTAALAATYRRPLAHGHEFYARAEQLLSSLNHGPFLEHNTRSIYYAGSGLQPNPATDMLNLQMGLQWLGADWQLSLSNALNSRPGLQAAPDGAGSDLYYAYTFRPRSLQLSVTRDF